MNKSLSPQRKRRWYLFSLRTLLLAFSLLILLLGWFSVNAQRQREAVSAIRSLGRNVTYRHQLISGGYLRPSGPALLRDLLADDIFDDVTNFFDDVVMANMGNNNRITDTDLEHLEGLTSLQWLSLGYSKITDAGLEHLEGLTSLQFLRLSHTHISDVGLEHLKGLTSLQCLKLNSTQITDAGMEHLKGLTSLRQLQLLNAQVTVEGVEKLREALPNCRIRITHPRTVQSK